MRLSSLFLLFVLCVPQAFSQNITAYLSLRTHAEWVQLCRASGRDVSECLLQLSQPSGKGSGRGMEGFVMAGPPSPYVLQLRSGVYLDNEFSEEIAKVIEDSGNKTVFTQNSGALCSVYSSSASLVTDRNRISALNAYARFIKDDPTASVTHIRQSETRQHSTLLFALSGGGVGAYLEDAGRQAGIWFSCTGPGADVGLRKVLEMTAGASRHFF